LEVYEIRYSDILDTLGLNLKVCIQDGINIITKRTSMFSRKKLTLVVFGRSKSEFSYGLLLKGGFIDSGVS
jgi:hypothetical protein